MSVAFLVNMQKGCYLNVRCIDMSPDSALPAMQQEFQRKDTAGDTYFQEALARLLF
jgi:hypothetical protein